MSRAFLFVCLSSGVALLAGGCTTETPGYCDETTPCAPGYSCNPETHTCQPATDGGGDGALDGTADALPDGGGDGPPTDGGTLQNGAPCAGAVECASGFCVDGVCCDAVCDGLCRSCALAGSEGTCSLASAGQDPDSDCTGTDPACGGSCDGLGQCAFPDSSTSCGPTTCTAGELTTQSCDGTGGCQADTTSCGGYACETTVAACKTSCAATADCTGTAQCVGGACVDQLPLGSACGTNNQACASKLCVDGVCCDSTCNGACEACDIAGKTGTCSPVADGMVCAASTCSANQKTEKKCASGSCANVPVDCGLYLCITDDCLTACSADSQCMPEAHCAGTLCVADKANGQPCTADSQCISGICHTVDKVCCNATCLPPSTCLPDTTTYVGTVTLQSCKTGTCTSTTQGCGLYRCDAAQVACRTSCSLDGHCILAAYCDGSVCKTKQPDGQPCTGGNQCQSGICAEGVCCDTACDAGPCDSCKVSGAVGTCSYLPDGTPCNGGTVACVNVTGSSYLTKLQCTGSSATCGPVKTTDCGTYKCTLSPAACLTSCTKHDQCIAGLCDLADLYGTKNKCPSSADVCHANNMSAIQSCVTSAKYVAVADGFYTGLLMLSKDVEVVAVGTVGPLISGGGIQSGVVKAGIYAPSGTPAIASNNVATPVSAFIHGLEFKRSAGAGPIVDIIGTGAKTELSTCYIHTSPDECVYYSGTGTQPQLTLTDVGLASCAKGIAGGGGAVALSNVVVKGMTGGYGIQYQNGELKLRDTMISSNTSNGVFVVDATLDWDRVRVTNNGGQGVRIENYSTTTGAYNLEITGNTADGLDANFNVSALTFVNATLADNGGNQVRCPTSGGVTLQNSIVWHPTGSIYSGGCNFQYSDVKGVGTANNNISQDPAFVGSGAFPYALGGGTPCLDKGYDAYLPATVTLDAAGNPRLVDRIAGGQKVDMGAYEVQAP